MTKRVALALAVAALGGGLAFAEGRREGHTSLPKGVLGFSGQVRGVVTAKGDGHFLFKIGRVVKVWDGNKAATPQALVGQTVRIGPRWEKTERGKWRKVKLHAMFIRRLKRGAEMTLEIRHAERDAFQILELSAEQRKLAHGKGDAEPREGGEQREGRHEGQGGEGDNPADPVSF